MAHDEAPIENFNVTLIGMKEYDSITAPTVNLSGCLYVSGGALYYIGSSTQTQLAAA